MVTRTETQRSRQRGALMIELLVAIALLAGTILPVAFAFTAERRLLRARYQKAVAMEIVDGEMEVLLAGGWRAYEPGTRESPVDAAAAANLPRGRFLLTIEPHLVRLEWQPAVKDEGGPVVREVSLP